MHDNSVKTIQDRLQKNIQERKLEHLVEQLSIYKCMSQDICRLYTKNL